MKVLRAIELLHVARILAGVVASFVLVVVIAHVLYALAARHYAPGTANAATGASASAVNGWAIVAPQQPTPLNPPIDLALQAGTGRPQLIAAAALNSAVLLVLACAFALGLGIPLGFWLGISGPRPVAAIARATTSVGITFPAFFLAFLLQLIAIWLGQRFHRSVVPVFGYGFDGHLVLPTLALALAPLAYATRLIALAAEDIEHRDFVLTARAKGMTERIVIYRHVAANMLGILGESALGAVRLALSGLVIIEFLLVWPGLGLLVLRAANVQDLPIFLGSISVLALAFLAVEFGLDVATRHTGGPKG
jgi:peptide/nickel transport system permease protein